MKEATMSSHKVQLPHATTPGARAGTKPAAAPDRPAHQPPMVPRGGIRTGVHWRPGPASAWRFQTEDARPPVDPEPET